MLTLIVSPREAQETARYPCRLAYAAYRVGPESSLLRQSLPLNCQGGLLSLSDREAPPLPEPEALAAALERECLRRGFSGAVLDLEEAPRGDLLALARSLGERFSRRRWALYLPEGWAVPGGAVLLNSAVSGGELRQCLREGRQRWGQAALDLQRLRMDFPLPCPGGEGRPLSAGELERLLAEGPAVFFSQALCARYFTYRKGGETRFVLFDDAETLRRKLRAARECGIPDAFCVYPEVSDLLPRLLQGG